MRPRDVAETNRTATPLELLFDLCFVVAVAVAADQLHHAVAADHIADGVISYLIVFFEPLGLHGCRYGLAMAQAYGRG